MLGALLYEQGSCWPPAESLGDGPRETVVFYTQIIHWAYNGHLEYEAKNTVATVMQGCILPYFNFCFFQ